MKKMVLLSVVGAVIVVLVLVALTGNAYAVSSVSDLCDATNNMGLPCKGQCVSQYQQFVNTPALQLCRTDPYLQAQFRTQGECVSNLLRFGWPE